MRPMLNPGLRRVWRDPATVQFGVDVPEPVVLHGIDDGAAALLGRLDGSMDLEAFVQRATQEGHQPDAIRQLIRELARSGVLIDAATWPGGSALTPTARSRLAPDLAASALTQWAAPGPADRCAQLAATSITIHGVGRLGAILGVLLSASGIGTIDIVDDRTVRPEDVCVAGFSAADVGESRASLSSHLAQWKSVAEVPPTRQLVIVTNGDSRQLAQSLTAAGTPHLMVTCTESVGRIGPFVLPGESSCLRCHDLTHTDRDPGWPRVVVQLDDDAEHLASDSNLTLATGATAVLHLISWLSGGQPPSLNGVVELRLPNGDSAQQPIPFHSACGCTWPIKNDQDTMVR